MNSLPRPARKRAEKIMGKARERTHMQVLGKLTDLVDEKYRLHEDAPFIVHETHTRFGRPINEALGLLHFYVRQLRDMKGGLEFVPGKVKLENIPRYCSLCGWALALAHAKSGDAAMIAGYVGNSDELDEAMARFALAYADQTEKDFQALSAAAKSGRIKVAGAAS